MRLQVKLLDSTYDKIVKLSTQMGIPVSSLISMMVYNTWEYRNGLGKEVKEYSYPQKTFSYKKKSGEVRTVNFNFPEKKYLELQNAFSENSYISPVPTMQKFCTFAISTQLKKFDEFPNIIDIENYKNVKNTEKRNPSERDIRTEKKNIRQQLKKISSVETYCAAHAKDLGITSKAYKNYCTALILNNMLKECPDEFTQYEFFDLKM